MSALMYEIGFVKRKPFEEKIKGRKDRLQH